MNDFPVTSGWDAKRIVESCPKCGRLVIPCWHISRGRFLRELTEAEREVYARLPVGRQMISERGYSRYSLPGGDHVCDPAASTSACVCTCQHCQPDPDLSYTLAVPRYDQVQAEIEIGVVALFGRIVTRRNFEVCEVCEHTVLAWPDLPYTVDPGWSQQILGWIYLPAAWLRRNPYGFCRRDGLACPHECTPIGDGPIDRQREREKETECGEGEGRAA